MIKNALTIDQLNVQLQNKTILNDFSLSLDQGDILCLLGPSGCGKTTALKALAGLIDASHGHIRLFDKTLKKNAFELAPEKRDIGFIFQDYALFPHMTVAQNIGFSLREQSQAAIDANVEQSLSLVHLDGLAQRYPHELSGGQQQRTAVARALANRPKLLLMDEPFSNIDSQVKQSMMAELRSLLKSHNITCIFVTHSKQEAFSFADKTAVMHQGKVEQVDTTQTIYEQPNNAFVANFMEAGNLIPADKMPHGLLDQQSPAQQGDYLLRENGFQITQQENNNGVKAKVLDSLYMGFRYRNEVQLGELKLFIESRQPLERGVDVMVRYLHEPIVINS